MTARTKVAAILFGLFLVLPLHPADTDVDLNVLLSRAFSLQSLGQDQEASSAYAEYYKRGGEDSAFLRGEYAKLLLRMNQIQSAVEQAKKAVDLAPKEVGYTILYAELLKKANRLGDALSFLESVYPTFEGAADIEFYLAEYTAALGRAKEAKVYYALVLSHLDTAGSSAQMYRSIALWRLADFSYREGHSDKAGEFLERYLKLNPDRLYAHYFLGYHIYYRRGDFAKALKLFKYINAFSASAAKEQGVNLEQVQSGLGSLLAYYGDYRCATHLRPLTRSMPERALYLYCSGDRAALGELASFSEKNPQFLIPRLAILRIIEGLDKPDVYAQELLAVGALATGLRQYELALDLLQKALRLKESKPDLPVSLSVLSQRVAIAYEKLNQPKRAIYYLTKSIEEGDKENRWSNAQERSELRLALARSYAYTPGKEEEAYEVFRSLEQETSIAENVCFTRGIVSTHLKRLDDALAAFNRCVELDGNEVMYRYYRAMTFETLDRFAEAEADIKFALKKNPRFAEANNFLGFVYAEKGIHPEESLKYIQKALDEDPLNGAYQDSLGWAFFRLGRLREARIHTQLAATLLEETGEDDPVVFDHLGDIYSASGEILRAVSAYARGLRLLEQKKDPTAKDVELRDEMKAKSDKLKKG